MSAACRTTSRLGCTEGASPIPSTDAALLRSARAVLRLDAQTLAAQVSRLGAGFVQAARLIAACTRRVGVLGVGKSGRVGRKIASTFSSTGSPSIFVDPSEGMHGDLGMITPRDVILALSFSGETDELKRLLPPNPARKLPLTALTACPQSRLTNASPVTQDVYVERE